MATFKQYSQPLGDASEAFSIESFAATEIKVRVDGVLKTAGTGLGGSPSHDYELQSYTVNGGTIAWVTSKIPAENAVIRIYREIGVDTPKATFAAGSSVKADDLNNNQKQALRGVAETQDQLVQNWEIEPNAVHTAQIKDANVTTAKIAADNITGALIADDQIDSEHYIAGSIDTEHIANGQITTDKLATNAVTTNKITDGNIVEEKLGNGSVSTAKIADNAVTMAKLNSGALPTDITVASANLVSGTIATVDIAADAIIGTKIADDAIDSEHYADGSIDTAHIADSQVTTAKIADSNITTAKIADSNITTAKIAAGAITSEKLATGAIGSGDIADGSVTTAKIAADAVTSAKIADNAIDSEHYVDGSIDTEHLAANAVTTAKVIDNAVTIAKINDTNLTTLSGMQSGTASVLADSAALTSTTAELNLLDGKSIVTTIAANATDVQLPSAQAVNERIVTVMQDAGGFVPIADKDSFPETNPDPNDDAGTIISIADAGGLVVNGSGVSTTGDTITTDATVTITGIDSTLNSSTIAAGKGMLVETTSTLNTYTYHRLTLDEAGVAAAQTAIDDFDERYYGPLSSAPTAKPGGGARADGDMYFDTTADKMKVWNNSATSWDDVATSASSFISTLSPAFDGSETEFTVSNEPVDAQSCIVSINGVVQKPNSGTSTPSEGFVQLANGKLKFATAPATGSDYFVITLGNAVSIGTPSPNTVGTTELENLGVTTAKIAADAITGAKIADDAVAQEHIADASVDEARLQISNSPTNGQFLSAQSGNTGGLTWAAVPAGVGGATGVDFNDNVKARFGTGNDLEIYHNADISYIDSQSKQLRIETDQLRINSDAGEAYIEADANGEAKLYYDNSKKLHTHSTGVTISGYLHFEDGSPTTSGIGLGNSDDIQIYHNGTNSFIYNATGNFNIRADALYLKNKDDDETYIKCVNDGTVELYHDNTKRLETGAGGVTVHGNLYADDNAHHYFGAGNDLDIYHDGSNSFLKNSGTGSLNLYGDDVGILNKAADEWKADFNSNGSVDLYYDNSKKFETGSGGISVTGGINLTTNLSLLDNGIAKFGTGDDLQIYHNGTNSLIENGTGELLIRAKTSENSINCNPNGEVQLFYDNSEKLNTSSGGCYIHGNLYPSSDGNGGIGTNAERFAEIFLKNAGKVADFNCNTSSEVIGIVMRHGRGGLSGYSGKMISFQGNDGTEEGDIRINVDTVSYNTSSDYRLKENEVLISNGITRLKTLKPYRFNFKRNPSKTVDGFFAHEVSDVVPEAISGEKDAVDSDGDIIRQSIDHSKLVPLLTAALQEAITKIETLETKVAALEAK